MMKKLWLFAGLSLLACNTGLFAQGNEIDAYTLSTTELNGTARSMAMGGAFGALGGDISVLSHNPAGLGIYRSSEISGTLDLSMINTSTNWSGIGTKIDKTRFAPNNFGFELYFPTSSGSVQHWNFGFSYNRLKNFNRKYKMRNNGQEYSLADYIASRASNAFGEGRGISKDALTYEKGVYDPYENSALSGNWLPVLGYESGFFDHFAGGENSYQSAFGNWSDNNVWNIFSPDATELIVNESGQIDEYNIGLGFNVSNILFLGASISVTDINYRYSSFYEEFFPYDQSKDDYLYLENRLTTDGSAVSVNLGAILNLQMLRLGVAYNSPRWYTMTDYYDAQAETYINGYDEPSMYANTPESSYSEYRFTSPGKWIFSGALILGYSFIVSADYEVMNYKGMRFSDRDGDDSGFGAINDDFIKNDYKLSHTLKLGTELKITPQFAVRAGYMMQTSPMTKDLSDNVLEVLPSGTIPHFTTVADPTQYYTVGLGYRFSPNFYMDLAAVFRTNSSKAYAFSNTYYNVPNIDVHPVYSEAASLKTKSTRLALTLGYKF
ncbi:MAG: outer membrane protein transport protein [Tannerella sp.]|jgi:hypothetical protein|nr:outer membrane protein transport protein [Tannerella sp.]